MFVAEYVPAVTIFTAAATCPAGHAPDTHAAAELAPAAEVVPAGQLIHSTPDKYAPAAQLGMLLYLIITIPEPPLPPVVAEM